MYEKQKEEPKLTPTYKPNSTGDKQIRITYVLPLYQSIWPNYSIIFHQPWSSRGCRMSSTTFFGGPQNSCPKVSLERHGWSPWRLVIDLSHGTWNFGHFGKETTSRNSHFWEVSSSICSFSGHVPWELCLTTFDMRGWFWFCFLQEKAGIFKKNHQFLRFHGSWVQTNWAIHELNWASRGWGWYGG